MLIASDRLQSNFHGETLYNEIQLITAVVKQVLQRCGTNTKFPGKHSNIMILTYAL